MRPPSWQLSIAIVWFAMIAWSQADEPPDWRIELLAKENIATDIATLKKWSESYRFSVENFDRAVVQLGSEQYVQRRDAQRQIIAMGLEVLPHIRRMPAVANPEVRLRLEEVIKALEAKDRSSKNELLRAAIMGLLFERENPGAVHASRRMFLEFFDTPQEGLSKGYGRMKFEATAGLNGRVINRELRMIGNKHDDEGDQRLVLSAKDATGNAEFPNQFRIEVRLGGREGGEGQYHVGVSVGNVRALYHPGYDGGAFRFEEVQTHKEITKNQDMGFDPPAGALQRMTVSIERQKNGAVKMDVLIVSGEKKFRSSQMIDGKVIGNLDQISLDRSGRSGGDGVFDDLLVDFGSDR
jgi:hypothetical protein